MEERFPIKRVIDASGNLMEADDAGEITQELCETFYRHMLRIRLFDQKCISLQRQGRIGTYAPFEGQEASQVGSALALKSDDWMFPSYRDHGAALTFGHAMERVLLFWNGRNEGNVPPEGKNIFPPGIPIATQIPHAVGAAYAEKLKGTGRVSIAYFGDGATSEGDFHEGLNFASVTGAPVVLFNQNNQYAISVPLTKQMKTKTIAQKGLAYDIPSLRIDGNDVFAVYTETKRAVERARKGEGPTLIESVTWRYGAHTTADDPTKYRDQAESEQRRRLDDPILRLERLMKNHDWFNENWADDLKDAIVDEIEHAVAEMESYPAPDPANLFDYVFEKPVWPVQEQKEQFLQYQRGDQK